jgi:hypothetical protein
VYEIVIFFLSHDLVGFNCVADLVLLWGLFVNRAPETAGLGDSSPGSSHCRLELSFYVVVDFLTAIFWILITSVYTPNSESCIVLGFKLHTKYVFKEFCMKSLNWVFVPFCDCW